jgi:predicted nucleotidyltransferase
VRDRGNQIVESSPGQYLLHLASRFGENAYVQAVVLAGSRGGGTNDLESDFDIYVYADAGVPVEFRRALLGDRAEIDNSFWEPGDEMTDPGADLKLDVMYRATKWIEDQLDRVLVRHEASIGYTTCFWFNVLHSEPLFDRESWFQQLQERAKVAYPDELRRAVIAKNWPILRRNQSSYRRQIEVALLREDAVSVQHRVTALLASFFDVWFALERKPHPGEKRLLTHLPERWASLVRGVLMAERAVLLNTIDWLIDPLDARLREESLLKTTNDCFKDTLEG